MGADAAKERRRLKRLETAKNGSGNAAPTPAPSKPSTKKREVSGNTSNPSTVKKGTSNTTAEVTPSKKKDPSNIASNTSSEKTETSTGQPNSSNALLRLRRKLERKAAGKFKLSSYSVKPEEPQTQKSSKSDKPAPKSQQKRKSADGGNSFPSKKPRKANPPDASSNRKKMSPKDANSSHKKTQLSKKMTPAKTKKKESSNNAIKKPKHLKRKVHQLSETMTNGSEGGNLADLEAQMKQLAEQLEYFKRMKGGTSAVSKADGDVKMADAPIEKQESNKNKNGSLSNSSSSSSDSSDSDDSSSAPKDKAPNKTGTNSAEKNKSDSRSSSSSSSDDDLSSDEEVADESTRSRGKRRRGRRGEKTTLATKPVDEDAVKEEAEESKRKEVESSKSPTDAEATPSKKKTSRKDDTRGCIGRKPVTDYIVGQKYSGKVKYIKSTLGAFIDIGSHSDAFCHISCISDGYAKTVEEVLNVDDDVKVRVVEVDREKKRVTVSLRSDEMAPKEVDGLKAKQKKGHGLKSKKKKSDEKANHMRFDAGDDKNQDSTENVEQGKVVASAPEHKKLESGWQMKPTSTDGQKSGADLKRERKLARRAERRSAQQAAE